MAKTYRRAYITTCEAFGWEGGPGYNTQLVSLRNGHERTNADWDQPQHAFSVPFGNILPDAYAPIKQMHLNCRGRNGKFLYRDRLDWQASNELIGTSASGQTVFQLGKRSTIDGVTYFRNVYALYAPNDDGSAAQVAPTLTVNGSAAGTHTVDYDRGTVTFASGLTLGDVVRWSGSFSLWVRFDNDKLPFSIDNRSGPHFVINGSVELLEAKPPKTGEV